MFDDIGVKVSIDCKSLVLSLILSMTCICLLINKYCLIKAEIEIGSSKPDLSWYCN